MAFNQVNTVCKEPSARPVQTCGKAGEHEGWVLSDIDRCLVITGSSLVEDGHEIMFYCYNGPLSEASTFLIQYCQ